MVIVKVALKMMVTKEFDIDQENWKKEEDENNVKFNELDQYEKLEFLNAVSNSSFSETDIVDIKFSGNTLLLKD